MLVFRQYAIQPVRAQIYDNEDVFDIQIWKANVPFVSFSCPDNGLPAI